MEYDQPLSKYDTFIKCRAVIIRAIAEAWSDPAFKKKLLEDPKDALKSTFNYDFPFDFDLQARDKSCKFTPSLNIGWTINRQDSIKLMLPPRPVANPDASELEQALNEAIALAEYNARHVTFL